MGQHAAGASTWQGARHFGAARGTLTSECFSARRQHVAKGSMGMQQVAEALVEASVWVQHVAEASTWQQPVRGFLRVAKAQHMAEASTWQKPTRGGGQHVAEAST